MSLFTPIRLFDAHKFTCAVCDKDIFDDKGFCQSCFDILPFNNAKTCKLCGSKLIGDNDYCAHCKPGRTFYEKAFSSFDYDGEIISLMYAFKYGNAKYLAEIFAKYMANTYLNSGVEADLVVAAPLSDKSLLKRGYNQSLLLAENFCALTNLPLVKDNLIKIKDTVQQERLNNYERRKSLIGAFALSDGKIFENQNIIVIDDVKTTGTTINRIAKTLKKAKAKKVYGLTAVSARDKTITETKRR